MGLVPLQESPERVLPPLCSPPLRIQQELDGLQPRRELSPEPDPAGVLISDFQPPEM